MKSRLKSGGGMIISGGEALSHHKFSCDFHVPVILRVPVMRGYNDGKANITSVGKFAAGLGGDVEVNLLPFHRLGERKSESLGRPNELGIEPPGIDPIFSAR